MWVKKDDVVTLPNPLPARPPTGSPHPPHTPTLPSTALQRKRKGKVIESIHCEKYAWKTMPPQQPV